MTATMVTPPRFPMAVLPTPLVRAVRLEQVLGGGPLLVKRDDLVGFAVAGNKIRPLEYLLGVALMGGADVLVTGGGPDSNFCPAAAVAARAAGLDCELVIWGELAGPANRTANVAIAAAAGARIHPTGDDRREAVDSAVDGLAGQLAAQGRRPFAVPRGGSTGLGAVGFATAAVELAEQLEQQLDEPPRLVVLPVGSGGSCAGLLAGFAAGGLAWPVLGVSVSRPVEQITERVLALAAECATTLGTAAPRPELLEVVDARGPGFGIASERDREIVRLALCTEGLLLDHTYTAKALRMTVDRLVRGSPGPVVFWHTGGVVGAVTALSSAAITGAGGGRE